MARYRTQRGVTVETSAENAAAMGYRPLEQQRTDPPQKKPKTRRESTSKADNE